MTTDQSSDSQAPVFLLQQPIDKVPESLRTLLQQNKNALEPHRFLALSDDDHTDIQALGFASSFLVMTFGLKQLSQDTASLVTLCIALGIMLLAAFLSKPRWRRMKGAQPHGLYFLPDVLMIFEAQDPVVTVIPRAQVTGIKTGHPPQARVLFEHPPTPPLTQGRAGDLEIKNQSQAWWNLVAERFTEWQAGQGTAPRSHWRDREPKDGETNWFRDLLSHQIRFAGLVTTLAGIGLLSYNPVLALFLMVAGVAGGVRLGMMVKHGTSWSSTAEMNQALVHKAGGGFLLLFFLGCVFTVFEYVDASAWGTLFEAKPWLGPLFALGFFWISGALLRLAIDALQGAKRSFATILKAFIFNLILPLSWLVVVFSVLGFLIALFVWFLTLADLIYSLTAHGSVAATQTCLKLQGLGLGCTATLALWHGCMAVICVVTYLWGNRIEEKAHNAMNTLLSALEPQDG